MAMSNDNSLTEQLNLSEEELTALNKERQLGLSSPVLDVHIEAGNGTLYAHRKVLCAKNYYFRYLINQQSAKHQQIKVFRIKFNDCSQLAMEIILTHLYTGKYSKYLIKDKEMLADVMSNAHMMDIKPLYEYCHAILMECINGRDK